MQWYPANFSLPILAGSTPKGQVSCSRRGHPRQVSAASFATGSLKAAQHTASTPTCPQSSPREQGHQVPPSQKQTVTKQHGTHLSSTDLNASAACSRVAVPWDPTTDCESSLGRMGECSGLYLASAGPWDGLREPEVAGFNIESGD